MKSLRFDHWAMPVRRRRYALAAVVLHRLQRMTVLSPSGWVGRSPVVDWPKTDGPVILLGSSDAVSRVRRTLIRHFPGHGVIRSLEDRAFDRATAS